ncbi:hypothetical protein LTR36_006842 [Oleoguttula mirabilis]|uniref:Peptidase S54 rhomboid domain-containing protein n=1 Tax=Oleoguttula mirabilis TaxID=1507867 RepID=A0AAV9JBA4_9PEZI|nr:hypothetical protein LTR36_006842 [Oleoguttula mirabilis]
MRAVYLIIGLNTAMFGLWQYALAKRDSKLLQKLHNNATCSWENVRAGRYWTLVTSAFTHTELTHFAFNMVAFYAFGSIMAWVPGVAAVHVISLSVGSAIAGSVSWLYYPKGANPTRDRRWGSNATQVRQVNVAQGASGMVMGAAATAACLMPFAPMYLMLIPVPIPLWVVTGLYAAMDIWYLDSGDKVGHAAHLGGSIYGALFYLAYLRGYGGIWQMARRRLRR